MQNNHQKSYQNIDLVDSPPNSKEPWPAEYVKSKFIPFFLFKIASGEALKICQRFLSNFWVSCICEKRLIFPDSFAAIIYETSPENTRKRKGDWQTTPIEFGGHHMPDNGPGLSKISITSKGSRKSLGELLFPRLVNIKSHNTFIQKIFTTFSIKILFIE